MHAKCKSQAEAPPDRDGHRYVKLEVRSIHHVMWNSRVSPRFALAPSFMLDINNLKTTPSPPLPRRNRAVQRGGGLCCGLQDVKEASSSWTRSLECVLPCFYIYWDNSCLILTISRKIMASSDNLEATITTFGFWENMAFILILFRQPSGLLRPRVSDR